MKSIKFAILFGGFSLLFYSCSDGSKTTVKPASAKTTLSNLFPYIDTTTLKNMVTGGWSGSTAKITLDGDMVITGFGPYVGGHYKIRINDSTMAPYTFDLLRYGVDTVISVSSALKIFPPSGGARGYYWMQMDGGNLPVDSIVRGDFIDSI